ncbi:50S ribosomal protein L10 [Helcococcus kunzii]|uniref:50S ribosomal protein L10 n=1 Tax=Helcococcus kunzii TaxID=40091 RepID=UPI0024AE3131|nr:50S ribosomal protein L10 [Helcococcus kunzii]
MSQSALSLKQQVVSEIKDAIQNSKSVSIVEYRGLTVSEISDLRNKYRAEGVSYKVYKNTMVKIALEELGYDGFEEYLSGPNGFVFSNEDMVAGPRVTANFAKENEKLVIKAGLLDGKVLNPDEVKALAKLPSREVLVAQVLGTLNAPIAGLANVLQGTIRKVVYALNAVKEKKEQEA